MLDGSISNMITSEGEETAGRMGTCAADERRDERWQRIHRELVGIAKRKAALDAEEAGWLREAERLQIWKHFGMVSMLDYLERTMGYAPRTGFDRMRVARALGDLPELTEALGNGDLSFSAVRELVRVATPSTESAWRQAARDKNLRQIEALVAGHRPGSLPDDPPDEQARLHRVVFEDVEAHAYALFRQARQILDEEHGTRMTDTQVLAAFASTIIDGSSSSEHSGRAKNQIAYTVCPSCERATQESAGARIPIGAARLEQARCDAQHIGSLDGSHPERATQDIPLATVRFVWRRDEGRCQTPGCRSSRGLEIHHIVPRSRGGSHDPANLTLRCGACHTGHHDGRISISGVAPHALTTTRNVPIARVAPTPPEKDLYRANGPLPIAASAVSSKFDAIATRTTLIAALKASGWKKDIATRAVDDACAHVGTNAAFEDLLRESFRRCPKG